MEKLILSQELIVHIQDHIKFSSTFKYFLESHTKRQCAANEEKFHKFPLNVHKITRDSLVLISTAGLTGRASLLI